jgi:hypothetical protein
MRMRYLCGHGRACSEGVEAIVGGIEAAGCEAESEDELSSGDVVDVVCVEAARVWSGVVFVGLWFTKLVMSSGVFAGVTLSMNCHDGSSKTIELWSEWLGTGMSDAESMSFCFN